MNSDRKALVNIGLFIFASALVGGYLKERMRRARSPNESQLELQMRLLKITYNVFRGAMEYFQEPLGMVAVILFLFLFIRAKN
jgi:hypothetical protein